MEAPRRSLNFATTPLKDEGMRGGERKRPVQREGGFIQSSAITFVSKFKAAAFGWAQH